jgi:hypothetical protein
VDEESKTAEEELIEHEEAQLDREFKRNVIREYVKDAHPIAAAVSRLFFLEGMTLHDAFVVVRKKFNVSQCLISPHWTKAKDDIKKLVFKTKSRRERFDDFAST